MAHASLRPHTYHAGRDDVRGTHRCPDESSSEDHTGGAALADQAVERGHPVHPAAHGSHDPPATERGSGGQAGRGRKFDPQRNRELRQLPARDEQQGDHAHRLLRVVASVAERERGGRDPFGLADRGEHTVPGPPHQPPCDRPEQSARESAQDR